MSVAKALTELSQQLTLKAKRLYRKAKQAVQKKEEDPLRISIVFPGAVDVIDINVNRVIGSNEHTGSPNSYECDPAFMLALSTVEGLQLGSVWTRAERYNFTTGFGVAYDIYDLSNRIAMALAEAFNKKSVVVQVRDDRKQFTSL